MNPTTPPSDQTPRSLPNLWPLAGLAAALALATLVTTAAPAPGFKSLFNGKDLTGWEGDSSFWSVKDGSITGQTTADHQPPANTFLIWKPGTVKDFELHLSFKIAGNNPENWGNSGIQYRSKDLGNYVVGGYQADFETGKTYSGILYEERGRGILAQRGQKTRISPEGKVEVTGSVGKSEEIQAAIKPGDWNEYVVIARGNHLIHKINGLTTVDVTDDQEAKAAQSGILALQLHRGQAMTVQFKNIELKNL